MGVKTAKKATVKKGGKAISGSRPKPAGVGRRISVGGRVDKIDAAVLSMAASVKDAVAAVKAMSEKMAASETMLSEKMAASKAECEEIRAESKAECDAIRAASETMLSEKMAASKAECDAKMAASKAECDAIRAKSDAIRAKSDAIRAKSDAIRAASEAMLSEKMAALAEVNEDLTRRIGGLRRSVGEVVELVLLPGLMQKMNGLNHNYTISSPRKEFHRLDGSLLTEVDLLLENCDEVMAVEAKTLFTMGDADRHLERLKKLRDNEAITGMRGKTIYAGAAGMRFAEGVLQKIAENGLYLIKIDENNDRITVTPPAESVGQW
jgi:colicin import membrane protein